MKLDITRLPFVPALLICMLLLGSIAARHLLAPVGAEFIAGGTAFAGDALGRLAVANEGLNCILFLTVVFFNAVAVTRLMIRNMIVVARTYLPLIMYVIVGCGIYCSVFGVATALSATLIMWAVQLMIRGFRRAPSIDLFFWAAFLIGITPLLYAPAMFYGAIIPVAVWLFRRSAREMTAAVFGFLLPTAATAYIMWAAGGSFTELYATIWAAVVRHSGYEFLSMDMGVTRLVIWSLLILLTSLSFGTFVAHINKMRTRQQRVYFLNVYLFAISFALLLLPCSTPAVFPLLAMPLAVILQTFFVQHAGTISSILYILLILAVVFLNLPV